MKILVGCFALWGIPYASSQSIRQTQGIPVSTNSQSKKNNPHSANYGRDVSFDSFDSRDGEIPQGDVESFVSIFDQEFESAVGIEANFLSSTSPTSADLAPTIAPVGKPKVGVAKKTHKGKPKTSKKAFHSSPTHQKADPSPALVLASPKIKRVGKQKDTGSEKGDKRKPKTNRSTTKSPKTPPPTSELAPVNTDTSPTKSGPVSSPTSDIGSLSNDAPFTKDGKGETNVDTMPTGFSPATSPTM